MGNIAFITIQDLADFYKNQHVDVKDNCSCNRGKEKGFCSPLDDITHIGGDVDFENDIVRGRGHQRHLSGDVVKKVAGELKKHSWPAMSYPTFEEFYLYVRSIVNIKGIGNLTVYDIATQLIKYFPGIAPMPADYVYLARGAMEGAVRLLGKASVDSELNRTTAMLLGLVAKAGYTGSELARIKRNLAPGVCVSVDLFKSFFPQLTAYEIEDVLCIYKIMFTHGGVDGNYPTIDDFLKEFNRRKAALRGSYKKKSITKYP